MRILILFIAFFLLSPIVFAQNFTISELIKINKFQIDDFDTYVTQKGYMYYKNVNDDFVDGTGYAFSIDGVNKSYISKFFYKSNSNEMVSFQTRNAKIYLSLKSELNNLGFKFVDREINNGTTFLNYKKGTTEVSLASIVQENGYGNKLTTYEISVTKFQ